MNPSITRDGIEVQIGQIWRDLDKRMRGRTEEIRGVADGFAYFGAALKRKIAIRRMYRHSTGWCLVTPEVSRLSNLLRSQDLSVYSCVLAARDAINAGKPYHEVLQILKVDSDKLRMHSEPLYALINAA